MDHNEYLKHYGVLGMKWGVRRYQNKDGSLTTSGKRRRSQNKNRVLSNKRKKNIEGKSNRDDKANKRLSTGKKVTLAVGTTAIVAAGAYFVHKYRTMNADAVIKKGKEFQRMGRIGEDLSKPFYASYLKSDNKAYLKNDFFGTNWKTQKILTSNRDLKIAGKRVSLDTFSEWVNTSPIAKEKFSSLDTSTKGNVKRAYSAFNRSMNSPDMRDKRVFNDFYSRLSNKGYDAIRDVNDQVYSGMKSPIFIFNGMSEIMTKKVIDLQ